MDIIRRRQELEAEVKAAEEDLESIRQQSRTLDVEAMRQRLLRAAGAGHVQALSAIDLFLHVVSDQENPVISSWCSELPMQLERLHWAIVRAVFCRQGRYYSPTARKLIDLPAVMCTGMLRSREIRSA